MSQRLRIGTRGSVLARTQTNWVVEQLQSLGLDVRCEVLEIKTGGDRDQQSRLVDMGGQGVFTKEIQSALLNSSVDVAIHSHKDLPTEIVPGLTLAAVPIRASPLDVLVTHHKCSLADLPDKAVIGTSSPRRKSQLLRFRPDLQVLELRGNVNTRLTKVSDKELDGIILAHAGLKRLGLEQHISEILHPSRMLPAPGQGALAIECRSNDNQTREIVSQLEDSTTKMSVVAERTVLNKLRAGCHAPVGCLASITDNTMSVMAGVFSDGGESCWIESQCGAPHNAHSIGSDIAERLLATSASEILDDGRQ